MRKTGTEYQLDWMEDEFEPETFTGEYTKHFVESLGYEQHLIDGRLVDPASIRDPEE